MSCGRLRWRSSRRIRGWATRPGGGQWGPQASDEPPTARVPDRLLAIRQLDAAVGWDAVSLGPAVVWPPIERARTGVSAANPQIGNAVGKVGCLRWERVPAEY